MTGPAPALHTRDTPALSGVCGDWGLADGAWGGGREPPTGVFRFHPDDLDSRILRSKGEISAAQTHEHPGVTLYVGHYSDYIHSHF